MALTGSEKVEARRRGRPRHEPTKSQRSMVELLAGIGTAHDEIASAVGISRHTLERHYRAELDRARAVIESKFIMNLMRLSRSTNKAVALRATMFALETRFGWSQCARQPRTTESEPRLGKKARAEQDAQTAHEGTAWSDLLQ